MIKLALVSFVSANLTIMGADISGAQLLNPELVSKAVLGHIHVLDTGLSCHPEMLEDFKLPEFDRSLVDFVVVERTHECGLDQQIASIVQIGGEIALVQDFDQHDQFDPVYLQPQQVSKYEIPTYLLSSADAE